MSPKENLKFYGHENAQKEFLDAYNKKNFHHAWLISGQKGIGKATLVYRIARFLFANGMYDVNTEQRLLGSTDKDALHETLDIDKKSSIINRLKAGTIIDLKVIEPDIEIGKNEITVDMIRDVNFFLSQTTAEFDWKIVIIDSADNMNRNAANALLKSLEEPPKNAIIFLISHSPRSLLPTIRSRCRAIALKPLKEHFVKTILDELKGDENEEIKKFASKLATGSAGMAVELCSKEKFDLYKGILNIVENDNSNTLAVYKFAEKFSKKDSLVAWKNMNYILMWFLAEIVNYSLTGISDNVFSDDEVEIKNYILARNSIEDITIIWSQVMQIIAESENLKLDKSMTTVNLLSKLC